jgi:hypothetical protein
LKYFREYLSRCSTLNVFKKSSSSANTSLLDDFEEFEDIMRDIEPESASNMVVPAEVQRNKKIAQFKKEKENKEKLLVNIITSI